MKLEGSVIMLAANLAVCIFFTVHLYRRSGHRIKNSQARRTAY